MPAFSGSTSQLISKQLTQKLIEHFGQKTYARALNYFYQNMVISCSMSQGGYHVKVSGQIKGSESQIYQASFSDEYLSGRCSCPVRINCKHSCVLLLHLAAEQGSDLVFRFLNKQLDQTPLLPDELPDDDIFGESDQPVFAGWQEKHAFERWSKLLQQAADGKDNSQAGAAQNTSSAFELIPGSVRTGKKEYLLYMLTEDFPGDGLGLALASSRKLNNGQHGKAKPLKRISDGLSPYLVSPFDESDRKFFRQMYHDDILQILKPDQPPRLLNRSPDVLFEIAEQARLVLDAEHYPQVTFSDQSIELHVGWSCDEQQKQTPYFCDELKTQIMMVLTDPPLGLTQVDDQCLLSKIQFNFPQEIFDLLMEAPVIPQAFLPQIRQQLKQAGLPQEQLPPDLTYIRSAPKPKLILDTVVAMPGMPVDIAARAKLHFVYGDLQTQIEFLGLADQRIEAEIDGRCYVRASNEEQRAKEWLLKFMQMVEPSHLQQADYQTGDFIAAGLLYPRADQKWLEFFEQVVPQLQDQGWQIEVAADFPYQLLEIDDDAWYGSFSEAQDNWFAMELGFELNGKKIDLMPILASQLQFLPSAERLATMGDKPVSVALGNQQFAKLPASRVRFLITTLLELYDPRGVGVLPSQALVVHEAAQRFGLNFSGGKRLQEIAQSLKDFKKLKNVSVPRTLKAKLRDYQQQGLNWLQFLREMGLSGLLADDMGLGKTVQTLAHILKEKQRLKDTMLPVLVVAPTSLMHNWRRETERFAPSLKVLLHHGSGRERSLESIAQYDLILTTYALVQRDAELLKPQKWQMLILDESQAIKNPLSKAGKAVRELQTDYRICLTGTPVENNLQELWSQFDFLMPGFLGNKKRFAQLYRKPIEKDADFATQQRLVQRIAPFMLRRTKDLVATELPPKTEMIREIELIDKQRDLYETVRSAMQLKVFQEVKNKGLAQSQIMILDAMLKMRQVCCDPSLVKLSAAENVHQSAKLDELTELLEELLSENRKVLIFSQFTSMLAIIERVLHRRKIDFVKITGQTKDRDTPIQQFQNGLASVFLISLKAGGTGLNLTAADTVIHYDPWWNPAVEDQATDRAHRIGQDKPVFVYRLVAKGTVEEKMQAMQQRKRALASGVYSADGKSASALTAEDLKVLFEPM
ncbi:DEAD/DEAH box helicase [Pelagibaculum spongiae]|uniref:Helicase n=1 Tax=Pelagibaculum spongiae TaxID=2080658 RepID=A0A2V1GP60_9GAMM|nr:DEAD/DEAH box helicase [Pelagibaculum spongiae]PVZ64355.1 helicase [Pelagibaculum spongiae]